MSQKAEVYGGIGIFGVLGIVFVTLKLCGVIDWSWWLVTMPFWIGIGLFVAVMLILSLIIIVCKILDRW